MHKILFSQKYAARLACVLACVIAYLTFKVATYMYVAIQA